MRPAIAAFTALLATTLAMGPAHAQDRVLRAGGTGVQAPMHYVSEDGTVTGIVVDLLAAIAADVGFEVEHVVPVPHGDLVTALTEQAIDITGGTFAVTSERAALVAFSIPYMIQGEALVIRRDDPGSYRSLGDFRGKRIGVIRGSSYVPLVEGPPPGTFAEIRYYELTSDLMAALSRGEVDGVVYGFPIAAFDLLGGAYPELMLAPGYVAAATHLYAFGLRKEDQELVDAINVSLENMMADGRIRGIFTRYGLPYEDYTR
ncbi:MAG: substrate-binding periplasmic protein [Bauldia sp.]